MATLKDKILLSEKKDELIKLLISDQSTAYKKSVLDGENIHLTKAQISALVAQFRAAAIDSEDQDQDSEDQDGETLDGEPLEKIALDETELNDLIDLMQENLLGRSMNDKDLIVSTLAPALATQVMIFKAQLEQYRQGLARYPLENLKYLKELSSIYLSFRK